MGGSGLSAPELGYTCAKPEFFLLALALLSKTLRCSAAENPCLGKGAVQSFFGLRGVNFI